MEREEGAGGPGEKTSCLLICLARVAMVVVAVGFILCLVCLALALALCRAC